MVEFRSCLLLVALLAPVGCGPATEAADTEVVVSPVVDGTVPSAQPGILDGRRFTIVVNENGREEPTSDVLIFGDGLFHSVECDRLGFVPAPYLINETEDGTIFAVESHSPEGATDAWQGRIQESVIEGSFIRSLPGRDPVSYSFAGTADPQGVQRHQ